MSGEKSSGSLNTFIKPIVDITASVAAVVAYLQAIFKLVDTAYPNTVSLLTIVFTSVIVGGWRWGKLNQKKKKSPSNGNRNEKNALLKRVWEPLKPAKPDPYALSLRRRRAEAGIILVLTVFTAGWTWLNAPDMVAELTSDPSLTCSYAGGKDALLILVADQLEKGSTSSFLISDKIYNSLVNDQKDGQYNVCRLAQTISLNSIAVEKATEHDAEIVIWGLTDAATYEIHLTAPALANPDRTLSEASSAEAAQVEFQFKEPNHVSYAAQFALSEILFMSGRTTEAQINQNTLIRSAQDDGLEETNPHALADGYFLLGLLYDPGFSENPDEEKALTAYHKALTLNPQLFAASFNRGLILMYANQVDAAISEFTYVIENNPRLKASALVNRASLLDDPEARLRDLNLAIELDPAEGYFFRGIERMNQEDYRGAIEDFEEAVKDDPQGFYNYHLLGLSQLLAGEREAAKQTYVQILPTLDDEARDQVIFELQEAAKYSPEIALTVEEIIAALQKAKIN